MTMKYESNADCFKEVAKRLEQLLSEHKEFKTKNQLATELSFNSNTVYDDFKGEKQISADRLYAYAKVFGVTMEHLLTGESDISYDNSHKSKYDGLEILFNNGVTYHLEESLNPLDDSVDYFVTMNNEFLYSYAEYLKAMKPLIDSVNKANDPILAERVLYLLEEKKQELIREETEE